MKRTLPHLTILLAGTGLLWAVAIAVQPDAGSTSAARYAHVVAHQSREGLAGLLFLGVAVLLVLSGLALLSRTWAGPGAGAIRAGGVLVALASTWLVASYAAFDMEFLQLVQDRVPAAAAQRMIDGEAAPWQYLFDLALLGVLLGPAVLAHGLRRNGRTGWLPMVLWLVGIVTYAGTEFVLKPVQVVSMLVCAAALFLTGRAAEQAVTTRAADAQPSAVGA